MSVGDFGWATSFNEEVLSRDRFFGEKNDRSLDRSFLVKSTGISVVPTQTKRPCCDRTSNRHVELPSFQYHRSR